MEAWQKVLIDLGQLGTVAELDVHLARKTCEECHGGDPAEKEDPELAHAGLVADPSRVPTDACAECHVSIAQSHQDSIHVTLIGEQNAIAARAGFEDFASCPESLKKGFSGECTSCHATCGDCHVSRPDSAGKGFIGSHVFDRKPHQRNQCMGCHGSRVQHDFLGDDEIGRKPDVHFTHGLGCIDCHSGAEMHASAAGATHRYDLPVAPTCEGCHPVGGVNPYHVMHWNDLSCQVCHAQEYNNCTSCHVGGAWQTEEAYARDNPDEAFRIGLNPLPERRFRYVTLRHAPAARDSFDTWEGAAGLLADYDAVPTWKYATPHSIRRWTPRTEVEEGEGCAASCHLGAPDGKPDNDEIYLFRAEIEARWPDEAAANEGVVVDGTLPKAW